MSVSAWCPLRLRTCDGTCKPCPFAAKTGGVYSFPDMEYAVLMADLLRECREIAHVFNGGHNRALVNRIDAALAKNPNPSGHSTAKPSESLPAEDSGPVGLGPQDVELTGRRSDEFARWIVDNLIADGYPPGVDEPESRQCAMCNARCPLTGPFTHWGDCLVGRAQAALDASRTAQCAANATRPQPPRTFVKCDLCGREACSFIIGEVTQKFCGHHDPCSGSAQVTPSSSVIQEKT